MGEPKHKVHSRSAGRRIGWGAVGFFGYMLSPLSPWNDIFVNILPSYLLSWPFSLIDERLFLPAFLFFYWASNVLGLVLLHLGAVGLAKKSSSKAPVDLQANFHRMLLVSTAYTAVITLLVVLGVIESPVQLLAELKKFLW